MMPDEKIKNSGELEFAVFALKMLRQSWGWMQSVFIRRLLKKATF